MNINNTRTSDWSHSVLGIVSTTTWFCSPSLDGCSTMTFEVFLCFDAGPSLSLPLLKKLIVNYINTVKLYFKSGSSQCMLLYSTPLSIK